jgi:hypothetical protein
MLGLKSTRQVLRLIEQKKLVGRPLNARQTMVSRASVVAYRQVAA